MNVANCVIDIGALITNVTVLVSDIPSESVAVIDSYLVPAVTVLARVTTPVLESIEKPEFGPEIE